MLRTSKYFLSLLLLVPAGSVRAEPLRVVTSIETFADLARSVGGAFVKAESLARGYQDPHFVEAKPSLLIPLSRADLLVYAGLDLEIGWLPPLVQGSRNPRIQPGAKADVLVFDLFKPHLQPVWDPLKNLVWKGHAGDIAFSMVHGEPVVRDGKLLKADEGAIMRTAAGAARKIWNIAAERGILPPPAVTQ